MDDGSLLIITPFEEQITRITKEMAMLRNKLMIEMADEIITGYASENGSLKNILQHTNKPISDLTFAKIR